MNKIFLFLALSSPLFALETITGYWKTINDWTDQPQSIVGIYEEGGLYFGRIVMTYTSKGEVGDTLDNPEDRAKGIVGNPYYAGLDIIFNVEPKEEKYEGKIVDPEKGRIYDALLWREGENLIVRGEMKLFGHPVGRNNKWLPVADADFPPSFPKPDLSTFTAKVPEVKKRSEKGEEKSEDEKKK